MSLTAFVVIVGDPPGGRTRDNAHSQICQFLTGLSEQATHRYDLPGATIWQSSVYPDESAVAIEHCKEGDQTCVIVFDGWIENREELIAELAALGVTDATSDSALALAGYRKWGRDAAHRLYGEYSFVVLDHRKGASQPSCLMVVDKVGVRPQFFFRVQSGLIVSNFPAGVVAVPGVPLTVNEGAVAEFLCAEVSGPHETLFRGVLRLLGGNSALSTLDRGFVTQRYWLPKSDARRQTEHEIVEELRLRVRAAVRGAIRSNTLIGVECSGGIDSSSVACTIADLLGQRQANPSAMVGMSQIYPGLACDESSYIDALANVLPFPIERIVPRYATSEELDTWTARLRYPFSPYVATASLVQDIKHAARGGRIIVTGEGGDELLRPSLSAWGAAIVNGEIRSYARLIRAEYAAERTYLSRKGALLSTVRSLSLPYVGTFIEQFARRNEAYPISHDLFRRANMRDRLCKRSAERPMRTLSVDAAVKGVQSVFFESTFFYGFLNRVERRHPLVSARVLELTAVLPLSAFDEPTGLTRRLLRLAVNRLPRSISERNTKAEFTPSVLPVLRRLYTELSRSLEARDADAGRIGISLIDPENEKYVWRIDAAQAWRRWITQQSHADMTDE